jgi:molybdopterin biosynthesis enzyme
MGYRPDRKTIPIVEARAILAVYGEPVMRTERMAVSDASGRVLAQAIIADRDVPPFAHLETTASSSALSIRSTRA